MSSSDSMKHSPRGLNQSKSRTRSWPMAVGKDWWPLIGCYGVLCWRDCQHLETWARTLGTPHSQLSTIRFHHRSSSARKNVLCLKLVEVFLSCSWCWMLYTRLSSFLQIQISEESIECVLISNAMWLISNHRESYPTNLYSPLYCIVFELLM